MKIKQAWSKQWMSLFLLVMVALMYWQMSPGLPHQNVCSHGLSDRSDNLDSLFEGTNAYFQSAGRCDHCHGYDPAGVASVSGELGDVNVVDDWSTTMMANAAKDPLWRAKVSHEVMLYPQLQQEIESTCTRCHAPMGSYNAALQDVHHYSINDMLADPVALDGVSCLACHKQLPQPDVAQHTGKLFFDTLHIAYGQYESPLISPMAEYTGLNPEYAAHISQSATCAGCHSLITKTVDDNGNLTDNDFIEQATWHEWLNSSYPAQNITCQSCHMPQVEGPDVKLAAGYNTEARPHFAQHTFVGANSLMLRILKDNRQALDIYASDAQFNETISKTLDMLQNQSVMMELYTVNRTLDTLYLDVKLTNRSGHKLPSGYPSRRMSLHVSISDPMNQELFRSGGFDEEYRITGEDDVELHHNIIDDESKVQIYEMVMGDMQGQRTTILNKAYNNIKDNRLAPLGFSSTSIQYDTTQIILGITDSDFNHDPVEGSGTDIIHYRIPLNGYTGVIHADAKLWYQTFPPKWQDDLFAASTPEIATFQAMFENADKTPVLMMNKTTTIDAYVGVNNRSMSDPIHLYEQKAGEVVIATPEAITIQVYDMNGKFIVQQSYITGRHIWPLHPSAGAYLFRIIRKNGTQEVKKVILHQ